MFGKKIIFYNVIHRYQYTPYKHDLNVTEYERVIENWIIDIAKYLSLGKLKHKSHAIKMHTFLIPFFYF